MGRSPLQSDIQLYLKQINKVPLLTAEEEKQLGWRIINDNCPHSKEMMIKANLRLRTTTLVDRSGTPQQASFCSEIRRVSSPAR